MRAAIEAVKELLRVTFLAVLSFVLTESVIEYAVNLYGGQLDAQGKLLVIGLATTVLRSVDKFMHKYGKDTDNSFIQKGITRF